MVVASTLAKRLRMAWLYVSLKAADVCFVFFFCASVQRASSLKQARFAPHLESWSLSVLPKEKNDATKKTKCLMTRSRATLQNLLPPRTAHCDDDVAETIHWGVLTSISGRIAAVSKFKGDETVQNHVFKKKKRIKVACAINSLKEVLNPYLQNRKGRGGRASGGRGLHLPQVKCH